jgi:tyrosyl-tRNA synthetase
MLSQSKLLHREPHFLRRSSPFARAFHAHRGTFATSAVDTSDTPGSTARPIDEQTLRSSFMREFVARGYFHQCTDVKAVDDLLAQGPAAAYIGFDATAPSFHVGSLLQIMILRMLQRHGHQPIVLIGGGTTRVGDPSGKDKSRQLLSNEAIQANIDSLSKVFHKYIDFSPSLVNRGLMVNNADWLQNLNYIDFLRDYGRYFSVNRMLTFDSVKARLSREDPLSFLEFNYMILQAYDFMELKQRHNVSLQIGGSDQWGNIVCGIELARKARQAALHGLTAPLVTTASGSKMGKTESGAVWLNRYECPCVLKYMHNRDIK